MACNTNPCSKEEFSEQLFRFFEDKEPKCARSLIQSTWYNFLPELRHSLLVDVFVDFVFDVIEVFRSTDNDTIQGFLWEYIAHEFYSIKYSCDERDTPFLFLSRRSDDILLIDHLEWVKKFSTISYQPLTPLLPNNKGMKRLLRYGVKFEMGDKCITMQNCIAYLLYKCGILEVSELKTFIGNIPKNLNKRKRFSFVLLFSEIILQKYSGDFRSYEASVQSLKLLFKTIPDPRIAITDIYNFFESVAKNKNKKKEIQGFCRVLLEIFPKTDFVLKPRTLKHLCRCTIRGSLHEAKKLPHGVWSTPLPRKLQNYILLQKTEDEFYSENTSVLFKILETNTMAMEITT